MSVSNSKRRRKQRSNASGGSSRYFVEKRTKRGWIRVPRGPLSFAFTRLAGARAFIEELPIGRYRITKYKLLFVNVIWEGE